MRIEVFCLSPFYSRHEVSHFFLSAFVSPLRKFCDRLSRIIALLLKFRNSSFPFSHLLSSFHFACACFTLFTDTLFIHMSAALGRREKSEVFLLYFHILFPALFSSLSILLSFFLSLFLFFFHFRFLSFSLSPNTYLCLSGGPLICQVQLV